MSLPIIDRLRNAHVGKLDVRVTLSRECEPRVIEGKVNRVDATGTWVKIRSIHVPVDRIEKLWVKGKG